MLGDDVARARVDEIYEEAGGNPFYLQQLARSHGTRGAGGPPLAGAALKAVGVPAPVIASLAQELGLLSADTRRVLRGAAVAGDPFESDLAAAAAGADDATAMTAFDELLDRRLDGLYTASIPAPALRGLPELHIPSGTWGLRIDVAAHTLRLIPPSGGDITLRLVGANGSHLRLAPDTACESRAGRTATSQFSWARTNALLRLESVDARCRSDATVLTSAPWQAAWPTTLRDHS
jgi:hypothetical protein